MKKLVVGLIYIGLTSLGYAQESKDSFERVKLSGVTLSPVINSSYLDEVQVDIHSNRIRNMENLAASFDISNTTNFQRRPKVYAVQFYHPNSSIQATFDRLGRIESTSERYKNVIFPQVVRNSIYLAYLGWTIKSNTYLVTYSPKMNAKKIYKVQLSKGDLKKRIKIDALGNLI